MRSKALLVSACLLIAAPLVVWMGVWLYLVAQEDYTPAPGSPTYYLGISSLVRHAPLEGMAGSPKYYGTVGDGNKLPHSQVSYESANADAGPVVAALHAYLLQRGFQPRASDTGGTSAWLGEGESLVRHAEYASASGEVAVLVVAKRAIGALHRITLTHFD